MKTFFCFLLLTVAAFGQGVRVPGPGGVGTGGATCTGAGGNLPAFSQKKGYPDESGTNTIAITFDNCVATGQLITLGIVTCADSGCSADYAGTITAGDNIGTTYAQDICETNTANGLHITACWFSGVAIADGAAGTVTVTVSLSGSGNFYSKVNGSVWDGMATSSVFDASGGNFSNSDSTPSMLVTTTDTNELVIGFVISANALSAGSGYTLLTNNVASFADEWKQSTSVNAYTVDFTQSGGWYDGLAAAYKHKP